MTSALSDMTRLGQQPAIRCPGPVVPINPKGRAVVLPSGEGLSLRLGAFVSDQYHAQALSESVSIRVRDPNRRFCDSGIDLALRFAYCRRGSRAVAPRDVAAAHLMTVGC